MGVRGSAGDGAHDGFPSYNGPAYGPAGYGAGYSGYETPGYAGYQGDSGYPTTPIPLTGTGHWEWVDDERAAAPPGYGGYRGHPARRRRRFRRLRRFFAFLITLGLLGALMFGGLLLVTPSVGNAQALAQSFDQAHHVAYPGPPVPARFAAALTATEDHRFYSEPGIDPFGVARVAAGAATGRPDPGGATLYQQLAKMLYASGKNGWTTQAEEVSLGVKLYYTYSHQQILQMYADVAYFGHGFYGLNAASCGYFGIHPARLSWPQAALLAGLVQAPSTDDPFVNYSIARGRESHVLGRLTAVGALTSAQASTYFGQSLHLVPGGGRCAG